MQTPTYQTIGNYTILSELGRGGMAVVYKAYQPGLNRYVALKVLPAHFQQNPELLTRFKREAQALTRLHHENIVQVFDIGEENGQPYFAMEFIDGPSLDRMLQPSGRQMTAAQVNVMLQQIGRALDYAHAQGIVHRDIKPSNIMLDKSNRYVLTDFGVAKLVRDTRITHTDNVIGTYHYMSPEQIIGNPVDGRADIYSLGITVYEMLAGRVPFVAEEAVGITYAHVHKQPPPLTQLNPQVPVPVERVVHLALAKEPAQRFPRAGTFANAFQNAIIESQNARTVQGGVPQKIPTPPTFRDNKKRTQSQPFLLIGIAGAVALVFLLGISFAIGSSGKGTATPAPTVSAFMSPTPARAVLPSVTSFTLVPTATRIPSVTTSPTIVVPLGPTPFGGSKKIAYVGLRGANPEIFVVNSDGTGAQNLTNSEFEDFDPSWSPDGSKIVFSSKRGNDWQIYVMNSDGSDEQKLTTEGTINFSPAWSSDGKLIAFASNRDDANPSTCTEKNMQCNFEIYVMNTDGTMPMRLTNSSGVDRDPAWSYDGKEIFFIRVVQSNGANAFVIYKMTASGQNAMQISDGPLHGAPAAYGNKPIIVLNTFQDKHYQIHLLQLNGRNLNNLSQSQTNDFCGRLSPDQQHVVFLRSSETQLDKPQLYVMNADGSSKGVLLSNIISDMSCPVWSPQ